MTMENKDIEKKVKRFFKLRFPEKSITFERKCGYFYEWCDRLRNNTHITYSDNESRKVWEIIENE